jgi:hypothetical protein
MRNTIASAPAKLAMYIMPQLLKRFLVLIILWAKAITINVLPVNSSAPASTIRIRPRENTIPPTSFVKEIKARLPLGYLGYFLGNFWWLKSICSKLFHFLIQLSLSGNRLFP